MNIHSSTTNFNKTLSQSKAVSFSALLSTAISELRKYGKNASNEFWKNTKSTGEADITSYKGLL
jgi:hypothetical protein